MMFFNSENIKNTSEKPFAKADWRDCMRMKWRDARLDVRGEWENVQMIDTRVKCKQQMHVAIIYVLWKDKIELMQRNYWITYACLLLSTLSIW